MKVELFFGLLIVGVAYYVLSNLFLNRDRSPYTPPPPPLDAAHRLTCGLTGWWLLNELFEEHRISVELFHSLADHPMEEIRRILLERELINDEEWRDYLEEAALRVRAMENA